MNYNLKNGARFFLIAFIAIAMAVACNKEDLPASNGNNEQNDTTNIGFQVPDIEDVVMYEVNLRAFSPGGDLNGVTNRLDNIKNLGVNVIWLMPIYPIGQVNSVNSPYSVKNYLEVGSEYGTLDDLKNLIEEAHNRDIAVILDWVANHTAWDNPWIENADWYTQDGNGNIVHPPGTNWQDVADLNYNNTEMRQAMIAAMKYWLEEVEVDGFRCDYADGVPYSFWADALTEMKQINNREFIFFAEGTRNDHFDAGFDLNFSWDFYGAIKSVFNGQSPSLLHTTHQGENNSTPDGKHWIRFTTNHDESAWDATPIELFNGADGALAASVCAIFYGGVPLIYGSQEAGIEGNIPFFTNSSINWNNNPAMTEAYELLLQFYQNSSTAKTGTTSFFPKDDIACFSKISEEDEIIFLVNTRNTSINLELPDGWKNSTFTNSLNGEQVNFGEQQTFEAYEYLILE